MNYYKYYLEIRNRSLVLFLTWIFTSIICYFYKEVILFFILNSINLNSSSTNYFIFTDLTEIFYVYIKLIFFISNQILFFSFLYHICVFLSLGLYNFEYNKLKLFIKLSFLSFLASLFLLNKVLIPLSWEFFLNFQDKGFFKPIPFFFEAKLSEYFEFYVNMYYLCLANCYISSGMLIIVVRISRSITRIKQMRKYFYFIFVLISTITTPPDVISQLVISLLLIFIYEFIIFLKLNKATN